MGSGNLEQRLILYKPGSDGHNFEVVGVREPHPNLGVYECFVVDRKRKRSRHLRKVKKVHLFGPLSDPYIVECKSIDDAVKAQGAFKDLLIARSSKSLPCEIKRVAILVGRPDRISAATAQEGLHIAGSRLLEESGEDLEAYTPDATRRVGFQKLFENEVEANQLLRMNITGEDAELLPRLLDQGYDPVPYMVQVYVGGNTLTDVLIRRKLSAGQCRTIGERLSRALMLMHGLGIVHQDCKPTNIRLKEREFSSRTSPDRYSPILLDLSNTQKVSKGRRVPSYKRGSFWVWAPEQVSQEPFTSHSTDIWAFGITMCLAYSRTHPVSKSPIRLIRSSELKSRQNARLKKSTLKAIKGWKGKVLDYIPAKEREMISGCLHPDWKKRPSAYEINSFYRSILG
ncbi:hypothetical protein D6825_03895 [Candidatus Woesearchaeota archaeon]|nr:MAG: hypothetical protein D6825_03895 [Candidatus Woesearchaeota archaeon]